MIEIPGYRLLRQLGRGGMATVYLAVQQSVDREVALKLMSPVLLVDPNFGDRFLREAKIAAKLHHRHVVAIHDVGRHDDYHYMAMEYLSGGPVLGKDGQARPITFALRITREIATALAYAHSKGFVHRDVKPDNILLRDDGSSALTDFGIARANDSAARMTRTGAVIGTPHYMSPEQARGRAVDGRSDLYSLGIVLYELLLGRVPFSAEDSLAVGIMHITQSVPPLPTSLATLQPLLDKFLAKRPENRYQSGEEVAAAIENIEYAIASGELQELVVPDEAYQREILGAVGPRTVEKERPTPVPPSTPRAIAPVPLSAPALALAPTPTPPVQITVPVAAPSTPTPLPAPAPLLPKQSTAAAPVESTPVSASMSGSASARQREEPSLGSLDDVVTLTQRRRVISPSIQPRRENNDQQGSPNRFGGALGWALLLAVGLGGVFFTVQYQDRLRGLLPNTELNQLISRADSALAAGKLTGSQGDSARELYQMARALDADNDAARRGLNKVGERIVEQARLALSRSDMNTAKSLLATARELLAGGIEVERLETDLRAAEGRFTITEELLKRAETAFAAGQLLGENGAAVLYQRVLDADPGNAFALNGLKKVAEVFVRDARAAIAANNVDAARQRVDDLAQLSPNHPEVPELRAELAKLHVNESAFVEQALGRADAQLRAGRFSGSDDAAQALFQSVLKRDPTNARAKAGLRKVAQALIVQANAALDDGNTGNAEKLLTQAETLAADAPELRATRGRLREVREQLEIAKKRNAITPEQSAQIQKLLDGANQAMEAGNLVVPPGESAFDKFRAVLRLDGSNVQAMDGLKRIPVRARELFDQAIKDNTPNKARTLLDAISESSPQDDALPGMRERLANAYLDQTEQYLADGRVPDATRALNSARKLNPNNARLAPLQQKLGESGQNGG